MIWSWKEKAESNGVKCFNKVLCSAPNKNVRVEASLWRTPLKGKPLKGNFKGELKRRCKLARKQKNYKHFNLQALFGCSFNIHTKSAFFCFESELLKLIMHSHVCLLFTTEVQKKAGVTHWILSLHIPALFMTSLTQLLGTKWQHSRLCFCNIQMFIFFFFLFFRHWIFFFFFLSPNVHFWTNATTNWVENWCVSIFFIPCLSIGHVTASSLFFPFAYGEIELPPKVILTLPMFFSFFIIQQ